INPRRKDLLETVAGSDLPVKTIEELKDEVEKICGGKPAKPKLGDRVIAAIKWVDGTVIDCVRQVM
ncbi:citrate lyase subunit alpha, partial [candidate division WOR-3 bacterium]|nr:citrate lyase subunit alpha [candidate division WOR-3 bacterium]